MRAIFSLAMALAIVGLMSCIATAPSAQRMPPGFPQSEPDLYNLGPIGGKAALQVPGGTSNKAASAFIVKSVVKDGPADKAGIKATDIICGALGKPFGGDAYVDLAKAIQATEALAKNAKLKLTVDRAGKGSEVEVTLTAFGKDAANFPGGKMRDKIVEDALVWLAKQQQGDGSWECQLSAENGKVCMTSLCGLAFMACGSTAEKGAYSSNVKKAVQFVLANIGVEREMGMGGGSGNWNQTNWGLGYGGIFLAQVQLVSPVNGIKEKLTWVRDTILKNMEETGGWAHGPGGPNALGYLELEIVSNYVLSALGGVQQCGIDVDKTKVDKALAYIQKCGGGKPGVGYSTRQGQVGWGDVGRTSGAINAFAALGRTDHAYYKPMVGFMLGNLGKIKDGHVSPMMHWLAAAIACRREGNKSWEAFWDAQREECTMLRMPDNTFTARPTDESATLGKNSDRDMGAIWCTAHWVIILGLEKDNLTIWLDKKAAKPKPEVKKEAAPTTGDKKPAEEKPKTEEEKKKEREKKLEDAMKD